MEKKELIELAYTPTELASILGHPNCKVRDVLHTVKATVITIEKEDSNAKENQESGV